MERWETGQAPGKREVFLRLVTSGLLLLLRFLMTAIALRNLAVGLPPVEQLTREVAFANVKGPLGDGSQDEQLKDGVGHAEL